MSTIHDGLPLCLDSKLPVLSNITTQCKQFLGSYHVHNIAWPWACFKVQKGCSKVNVKLLCKFCVRKHLCKVTAWCLQFLHLLYLQCHLNALKIQMVTQRSTSNLAEILIWKPLIPVKLQQNAGKFRGVIIYTICCQPLSFDHDLFQRVQIKLIWPFDVVNISVKL